jgi:hypothetical protein
MNNVKKDDRFMFRISASQKEAFLNKVNQEGKKASDVLLGLIDEYLSSVQPADDLQELKQRVKQHEHEITLIKEKLLGESVA